MEQMRTRLTLATPHECFNQYLSRARQLVGEFKARLDFKALDNAIYHFRQILDSRRKAQRPQYALIRKLARTLLMRYSILLHSEDFDEALVLCCEMASRSPQEAENGVSCFAFDASSSPDLIGYCFRIQTWGPMKRKRRKKPQRTR